MYLIKSFKIHETKTDRNQNIDYSGHKTSLKFKRIQVIQSIFSAHKWTKLENNNRKISGKLPNILELNKTFLNNQRVKEETKSGVRKYFQLNKNENTPH